MKPVSLPRLAMRFTGWAPLICAAVAVACYAASYFNDRKALRLSRDGVRTEAVVTSSSVRRVPKGTEVVYEWRRAFEFPTEEGEVVKRSESRRSKNSRRPAQVGSRFPVRYWRENPQVFEFGEGGSSARSGASLRWIAAFLAISGVLSFGWGLWYAGGAVRVRETGRKLRVKVRRAPEGTKSHHYRCVFWKTDDGLIARSRPVPRGKSRPQPGETIVVFTDGKRCWWEGDVGSRRGE